MDKLSSREAHQIARRLHLIQVLLNYRTMQGGGYLFALWPRVKKSEHRAEQVRLAAGYINSHPVFAAFAVGAMRKRLEAPPLSPPLAEGDIVSWRESLAGPLGITGDALIWDRWKPFVFSLAALTLLLMPGLTTWIVVATMAVIMYNAPLYALRVWAVRRGYELGERVLEALRDERFLTSRRFLTFAGIWVAGALAGVGIWIASQDSTGRGVQFVVAFVVMLLGLRFRLSASTAVLFAVLAALVVPGIP